MGSTTFELTCIFHFGNILVIVMFIFANYVKGKKTYESFDSLNKLHINFFFFTSFLSDPTTMMMMMMFTVFCGQNVSDCNV